MSKQREQREPGYGLCYQCGRKQPFMKGDIVRFRCDGCERVYEVISDLLYELHLMNRRVRNHPFYARNLDKNTKLNLVAALIEGETSWRWFK